jgi:hypothetical protein
MAIKTLAQLKLEAIAIRDEVIKDANTATRVGTFMNNFVESVTTIGGHLWEFTLDGSFFENTPLDIAAGVRTQLTNDGIGAILKSEGNTETLWDTTTNKITPIAETDFYTIRVAITGQSVTAPVNRFDVELDTISGTFPIIARETFLFSKGAGGQQSFNFTIGLFAGPDFVANGGTIFITPEHDAHFWEIAVTISRAYTQPV